MQENSIAVLGDLDLVLGMKLSGANICIVYEKDSAAKQVEGVKDFEIVIMTEDVAADLKEKKLFREIHGSIVQVPDKSGSKGLAMKGVSKLFEDALGLKIEK